MEGKWRFLGLCVAAAYLIAVRPAHAGYTHYFTWKAAPSADSLKVCVAEMKQIIASRAVVVAGPDGNGKPTLAFDRIGFNGRRDDAHEPFIFPGEPGFNFCKTEAKPYDEVVVACLFVARDHFPASQLEIASDGQDDPSAFDAGRESFEKCLSRKAKDLFASGSVAADTGDEKTSDTGDAKRAGAGSEKAIPRWGVFVVVVVAVAVVGIWLLRTRMATRRAE